MKKEAGTFVVIAAVCCSVALMSCAEKKPPPEASPPSENLVFISGSAAVTPLLKTLASEFSKKESDAEIVFLPDAHSEAGITGTTEEKYDMGLISREMLPSEKQSPLRYLHLAKDGMVFATNLNVRVANLNSDQIRDIYAGSIVNWSEVGGPDARIAVIDRPEHTSAKLAMRRTFLGDELVVTPDAISIERPWQVTDSIQLVPYSIGYTSLGEIVSENPPVNIISVNGVAPTPANLIEGKYRFFRPFGVVLGPTPKASTMRFVNFIYSDDGSRVIQNSGYVPQRYEIVIGIVPEQDVMVQRQRYEPLTDYLSRKMGESFSVKLKLFSTYAEVCNSLADGSINAAFLGSLAYAAVRKYVNVLARPDYNGISTYRGIIFVRANSGIDGLEKMRGKRLVMGGRTTTAGYVFPLYFFKQHGISDYRSYFSEANFVGTHEDAILAVLHNNADVGAAKDLIYRMIAHENPLLETSLKVLAASPPVPSNAFVLRKDLELPCFDCHQTVARGGTVRREITAQFDIGTTIKRHLLSMPQDPEGRDALAAIGNANRFLPTTDADYSELYKMLEEIDVDPESLLGGRE